MSAPDAELEQLRRVAAAQHGLDSDATSFLVGASLSELEESAAKLAQLVGGRDDQEPEEPDVSVPDLFSTAARARRKEQLTALFCSPPPQPRDACGRWVPSDRRTAITFDGGVRGEPLPVTGPPEQEHGRWLLDVLARRRADRGADF
jgi:hypothetical protein